MTQVRGKRSSSMVALGGGMAPPTDVARLFSFLTSCMSGLPRSRVGALFMNIQICDVDKG